MVTCSEISALVSHTVNEFRKHTEVEVVLHAVAEEKDTGNGVDEGYMPCGVSLMYRTTEGEWSLTSSRLVLSGEVASLVASNEASGLDLRGGTARKSGVEVHNTVHAGSILGSTDRLFNLLAGVIGKR